MSKPNTKYYLKRKQEIESAIQNLEQRIEILERERREIINYLDLNKDSQNGSEKERENSF